MEKQKFVTIILFLWVLGKCVCFGATGDNDSDIIVFSEECNSFSEVQSGNYDSGDFYLVSNDGTKYKFNTTKVMLDNGKLKIQGSGNKGKITSPKIPASNGSYIVNVYYYQSYTSGTSSISKLSYGTSSSNSVLAEKDGEKVFDTYKGFVARLEVPDGRAFTFSTGTNLALVYRIEIIPNVLTLSDGNDNSQVISDYCDKTAYIKLNRTLVADKWNTFCVPFDIKDAKARLGNAEIKEYDEQKGVVGNVMYFKNANEIKAGYPYLVKPTKNVENPKFEKVAISAEIPRSVGNSDYKFVGVYNPLTFDSRLSDISLFLSSSGKLVFPQVDTTMRGMRAYFSFPGNLHANAAEISMDNTETALTEIHVQKEKRENVVYSIGGVQVGMSLESLPKGVYITKGKKIVVK